MNELVEKLNTYLSAKPGLVPLIGVILIILNLALQIFVGTESKNWFVDSNLLLHVGIITSIIGLLVIRAWSD